MYQTLPPPSKNTFWTYCGVKYLSSSKQVFLFLLILSFSTIEVVKAQNKPQVDYQKSDNLRIIKITQAEAIHRNQTVVLEKINKPTQLKIVQTY